MVSRDWKIGMRMNVQTCSEALNMQLSCLHVSNHPVQVADKLAEAFAAAID